MDYRIDDLAQAAGTTVRNVRVYQDRGLLPPPRREGRAGIYSGAHLARLRVIAQLLERGFTFVHIAEFLEAWQEGRDLTSLLGLEQVLTTAWSDELATWITRADLEALYGPLGPDELAEVVRQELLVPDSDSRADRFRVPSPRLLHAGAELVQAGIPLGEVLTLSAALAGAMDAVAARMVAVVTDHLVADPLTDADVEQLAALVGRLKPLAQLSIDAHLARAMERRVADSLREHLLPTGSQA